jgi:DNA repair exonuclease SbcCD ATPase subunit
MIILKELRWSNAFSYGKDNVVNFVASPLTQLVGRNGHGKSSVALILEEVLFNKNSKGIKKADILNRYIKEKSYTIELDFEKDNTPYQIKSSRGSTQTVKLFKNGNDISSHTATATYKVIEDIIGFDHKTFAQIVYQSNASSLEFLTAPDTARKKFLIELLNLGVYTRAQEVFKDVASDLNREIASVQSQVATVNSWLNKYSGGDLNPKPLQIIPEFDQTLTTELAATETKISNIESANKKITQNNTYKKIQAKIKLYPLPEQPTDNPKPLQSEADKLNTESVELNKTIRDSQAFVKKMGALCGTCPTCLQEIDETKISELMEQQTAIQQTAQARNTQIAVRVREINALVAEMHDRAEDWKSANKAKEEWEKYHALIDQELETELYDKNELDSKVTALETAIFNLKNTIQKAEKVNREASTHNAKVELLAKQLVEMNEELETYSNNLHELSERMGILNILTKTFSTTGLVAYKIECLVKDLEELTNEYLVDLSDGRFQIAFRVSSSDKLNVIITDNSKDIDILALSGGERARVNVATLLAIRKLMQSLSSSRINLLILDETVEALDVDGKERLVEVLLREEFLNTFLVSHGFTHPLLEKIHVVKSNNISKIEV